MELLHIPLGKLYPSPLNMRHGKAEPDVSDILPLVRARGILVPLLVRPDGERYEVIAGRRRYFAARTVEQEAGDIEPLPCGVLAPGDNAAAVEASIIENMARLDPDEMTQHEALAAAILDRLLHHCHVVQTDGASYRLRHIEQQLKLTTPSARPNGATLD